VSRRLLLDEHYSESIAAALRERGHDVVAVVADAEISGASDSQVYRFAAEAGRRIVTENIKDFRPLLMAAMSADAKIAPLLLVHPRRFPRGRGDRTAVIVNALDTWLQREQVDVPLWEDWLV
jgi:hypothetical protein